MMGNILKCEYNWDNGYVEVFYKDGGLLRLKCEEIESQLELTIKSESILQKLLDENPIEYVIMALAGELQGYCDLVGEMRQSMYEVLLQQYLEQGYDEVTAGVMVREFLRYDS